MAAAINVIYAEDDEVFRTLTVPAIVQAGIPECRVHVASDGLQALQLLKQLEADPNPILMVLDEHMPLMDGIECAWMVRDRLEMGLLANVPYIVISSVDDPMHGGLEDPFNLKLQKHLGTRDIRLCLLMAQNWWRLALEPGTPKGYQLVIADAEPCRRAAVAMSLMRNGASRDLILEADEVPEMMKVLDTLQSEATAILFLAHPSWLEKVPMAGGRKFFKVSTAANGPQSPASCFNAALPPLFEQSQLRDVLKQYNSWRHRGVSGRPVPACSPP